jgi:hypothetical protein
MEEHFKHNIKTDLNSIQTTTSHFESKSSEIKYDNK